MRALSIERVSKNYGSLQALQNINMSIEEGDFVGLLGVNGAGKTSLISSIAGLNRFQGTIKVMGYDVLKDVVLAKKNLGVVPQEIAFDPFLTVYKTLKLQSGLYGVKKNKEWIFEVLERLHLADKANSNARSLSGGMKRRLMVAQALVHKPPLLILDEPTAGVDVELRKNLWGFISELHHKGHTILLTTHYLEEVEQMCDKIIVLNQGRILAQSSKTEFLRQANNLPTTLELETLNGDFSSALNDFIISKDDNLFTLKLRDNDHLLEILTQLKLSNITIEHININRPNLEDVFINYLHR